MFEVITLDEPTESDCKAINSIIVDNQKDKDSCYKPYRMDKSCFESIERNRLFLAKESNSDACLGYGWLHDKTESLQSENCHPGGIIVVHPKHRKRGVGGRLLKAIIQFTRDHTAAASLAADVKACNKASIALCEKYGFEKPDVDDDGPVKSLGFEMVLKIER